MARQIYRQESLERLSSPEQLDMLMPVTSARGWIALSGVGLLLLMAFAWSIFYTFETTVEGNGLLLRHGRLEWVESPLSGSVKEILVKEGDSVKKGAPLVRIEYMNESGETAIHEISSLRGGRVLDVAVVEGSPIVEQTPLVSVESLDDPLQAVVYIPAGDGYKVAVEEEQAQGQYKSVKVLPATETARGAVFLRGKVVSAARFPASRAEMMDRLQNEDWVNNFLSQGPVLEVVIEIEPAKGLDRLYGGTSCRASVTIQRRKPIEFLVPGFGNQ